MGLLNYLRTRGIDWDKQIEIDIGDISEKIHMKHLAVQTCVNMISKTIIQTEFKIDGKVEGSKEILYRLNVRPNVNQSASEFWQKVVAKLIYDNEVLIIQSDEEDLLIADSFERKQYAMVEDIFKYVTVNDFEFSRTFTQNQVLYIKLNNDNLMQVIDGLYGDYGELFARIMEFQKRKGQIRGTVELEGINAKDEKTRDKIEAYISKVFNAFTKKTVAVIPQQKGMTYKEIGSNQPVASVDEINKVTDGFLNQIAKALGIPIALLIGEMADVEKQTKNYMSFCIRPWLKIIANELNGKLVEKEEYMNGGRVKAIPVSLNSILELATSIDKVISSGFMKINEVRVEVGLPESDEEMADQHFITKNYRRLDDAESSEGGDNE